MANKLDRIEKDIEKTKAKIAELQKQLRELEAAKTEQENLQIIQLVRGLNMKPEEFAAFLRGGALQSAPAPQPDFEQDNVCLVVLLIPLTFFPLTEQATAASFRLWSILKGLRFIFWRMNRLPESISIRCGQRLWGFTEAAISV